MALYLRLFHGRSHPDEELDDWGSDGPVLGPFKFVHTTYACHIKMGDNGKEMIELFIHDDMVYYDGVWYGDWSVFGEKQRRENKFKVSKWSAKKAKLPDEHRKKAKVQTA